MRAYRRECGITFREVSALAGISPQRLAHIESHRCHDSSKPRILAAYAQAVEARIERLRAFQAALVSDGLSLFD